MVDYDNPDFDPEEIEYETMYTLVGYFIAQYSMVELGVTMLLAKATESKEPRSFHVLTKGMDLKVKIQRLKEICAPKRRISKDSKLLSRLNFIYDYVADLRNNMAHTAIFKSTNDPQRIIFSSIGRMRPQEYGYKGKEIDDPPDITFVALRDYAEWLNVFQTDLLDVLQKSDGKKVFEIARPQSMEPEAFRRHLKQQDDYAKAHSHDGKQRA